MGDETSLKEKQRCREKYLRVDSRSVWETWELGSFAGRNLLPGVTVIRHVSTQVERLLLDVVHVAGASLSA